MYDAATGAYKDRVVMPVATPVEGVPTDYVLTGFLTAFRPEDLGKEYRLVVLANLRGDCRMTFPYAELPALTEQELYDALWFPFTAGRALTDNVWNDREQGCIPLWGKATTMLTEGTTVEVEMLRAVAKVDVRLSESLQSEGLSLEAVRLVYGQTRGAVAPRTAATAKGTFRVTPDNVADNLNCPASSQASGSATRFLPLDDGSWLLYLPEQPARPDEGGAFAQMGVVIDGTEYRLYFADYSAAGGRLTAFPVIRNTWYSFTITAIKEAQLVYEVDAWEERTGDVEFH